MLLRISVNATHILFLDSSAVELLDVSCLIQDAENFCNGVARLGTCF